MISKTLSRRLERLEGSLMSTGGPRLMEIRVISLATGEVIKRILTQWGDPHERQPASTTMATENL